MTEPPHNAAPRITSSDIDLYCLECGYNLRGLSGDPRRCPECGHLNPMGDLEIPAELISAQLREMEAEPAMCAGAAMVAGVCLVGFAYLLLTDLERVVSVDLLIFMLPIAVSVAMWVSSAKKFRTSCMCRRGWGTALWRYHLYSAGLSAIVIAILSVRVFLFPIATSDGRLDPLATSIISFAAALAVIWFGGRRAHKRLREMLEPLQREVAVTIARETLRRRLQKPSGRHSLL